MSNEIRAVTGSAQSVYAVILNSSGQFFNGATFENFSSLNYSTYVVHMTEQGDTGIYFADFPSAITTSGTYDYYAKVSGGGLGAEAQGDTTANTGNIDWTGIAVIVPPEDDGDSLSADDWRNYVLRGGFKRTDKDAELFEETTDAIQEMRRRLGFQEAGADTTTTDTITVLGDFKLDLETDFGMIIGITVQDGQNATPLIQLSKHEFEQIYPDINVTQDRGYPKHFTIYGDQIQIGPIPDRTSYSYRVSYSRITGNITGTTTAIPFTAKYRDVLRANVLSRLWDIMDEFDKAQRFRNNFELRLLEMTRQERKNSGVGHFNVRPYGM